MTKTRSRQNLLRIVTVALLGDIVAGLVVCFAGTWSGEPPLAAVGLLFMFGHVLAVGFSVWAGRHPALDTRTRLAWRVVALAMVVLMVSDALRPVWPLDSYFPSPADLARLGFAPLLLAGLLLFPLREQSRRERTKLVMDTGVVMTAAAMLLWYIDVEPMLSGDRVAGSTLAAAIAYPASDLTLIFGAAVVLIRGAARSARRPVGILVTGMLLISAGDVAMCHRSSTVGAESGRPWEFACWLTGSTLLSLAAVEQCRLAAGHRLASAGPRARGVSWLPYLAMGLGYLLLTLAAARYGFFPLGGLVVGCGLMCALVVGRQIVAQRETHEMAVTDGLTGLVNRARLHDKLRLALSRGQRAHQGVAVLHLDMNGFKAVNDTLGHEAGDKLLVAFGQLLRRNVLGSDVVGRLGGDEFAAVLHNVRGPDEALAVVRRIVADMGQPVLIGNTPIQPRASIGIALCGSGELSAEELLHRADLAMYAAKRDGSTGYQLYDADRHALCPLPTKFVRAGEECATWGSRQ
jgi:diguanylate cyclase